MGIPWWLVQIFRRREPPALPPDGSARGQQQTQRRSKWLAPGCTPLEVMGELPYETENNRLLI
jgi:hypothetical protein